MNNAYTSQPKKNSFIFGAVVLAVGGIFAKFLGMFFRIPVANILGDVGLGYYSIAYPLYSVFLSVSTVGIPTAVSKMVSERASVGNYRGAAQIQRLSFLLLSGLGLAATFIMGFGALAIAKYAYHVEEAYYSILALAPAPFLIAMLSSYRGYMQGMQKMASTSISQIIDQVFRVIIGLGAAYYIMSSSGNLALAAGGASLGATAGGLFSFLYMAGAYASFKRSSSRSAISQSRFAPEPNSEIFKRLLAIALPIAVGGLVTTIMGLINSITAANNLMAIGFTPDEAVSLMGALEGKAQTLVNVPFVLGTALSTSLVPSISASYAKGELGLAAKKASLALKLSFLVSLPAAAGLSIMSKPIMTLLFGVESTDYAPLLSWLSYVVVFTLGMTALQGILQGAGHYYRPIRNLIMGVAVKLILNIILIRNPSLNIYGAIISSITASAIIFTLNLIDARRYIGIQDVLWPVTKILFATAVMGALTHFSYQALSNHFGIATTGQKAISLCATIAIAITAYIGLALLTKSVTKEELQSIRG